MYLDGSILVRSAALYIRGYNRNGDHMGGYGYMMNSWTGAILMGLVILILIGVLIYFLFRGSKTGGFGQAPNETPLDILKKRYARGEITKEQFEEMKKDL